MGFRPFPSREIGAAQGLALEVEGLERLLAVGDRGEALLRDGRRLLCETVGFRNGRTLVMPFGSSDGVTLGTRVRLVPGSNVIFPDMSWRGRVLNALAQPLDAGPLLRRRGACHPRAAAARLLPQTVGTKLATAVRALDIFVPLNRGQRLGVFAGSGVSKSSLLSMIARASDADINVIALVGERGREVQEFIRRDLGEEGLAARSVLVVSTSDEPPLPRRQAAWTAMTIAEYFRDQGLRVAFMMDSVTASPWRGGRSRLATGEPPTTRLSADRLRGAAAALERAGPGMKGQGDITGIFSVLVDGDDHNEPIADAVQGILDGHVVLDRKIADRGRFPPSTSCRASPDASDCHSEEELKLYRVAKEMLAAYEEMADMIRIGAYERAAIPGSMPPSRSIARSKTSDPSQGEARPRGCLQRLEEILQQVPGLLLNRPPPGIDEACGINPP